MPLRHLADNVWLWPSDPDVNIVQPNMGVIIGQQETVLVDAGHGPGIARQVSTTLAEMGAPPVKRIIYTHHHWDHVFGAYGYPEEITAVAHTQCRMYLQTMSQQTWTPAILRDKIEQNPNLKLAYTSEDWQNFHIILPTHTFDSTTTLTLDRTTTIQLQHVGGRHAADSIIVHLVEAGIAFLGDCYYPGLSAEDAATIDFAMLQSLLELPCQTYIDGHKPPYTRRQLDRIVRAQSLLGRLQKK